MKPGTSIVSHTFKMGNWKPEKETTVDVRYLYLWRVPPKGTPPPAE